MSKRGSTSSLAVFGLLKKPELSAADLKRIKKVAFDLLQTLKPEKLKRDHWRDKGSTRDAMGIAIRDFLWSEETGLPVESYTKADVSVKADEVFRHFLPGLSDCSVTLLRECGGCISVEEQGMVACEGGHWGMKVTGVNPPT